MSCKEEMKEKQVDDGLSEKLVLGHPRVIMTFLIAVPCNLGKKSKLPVVSRKKKKTIKAKPKAHPRANHNLKLSSILGKWRTLSHTIVVFITITKRSDS